MAESGARLQLVSHEGLPRESRSEREPLWRHLLGGRLRALRHERDETLIETARRAGVSSQYLSEVERGVKEPSSEVIAAIADSLDVTLLDLTLAVARDLRSTRADALQPGDVGGRTARAADSVKATASATVLALAA